MRLHTRKLNKLNRSQAIIATGLLALALLKTAGPAGAQRRSSDRQNAGKKSGPSETSAGVLKAVGTVGLILVRNAGDPVDHGPRPRGSGVVVRKDGVVVTNLHVIAQDASSIVYEELFFSLPDAGMAAQSTRRRYRLKPVLIKKEYDLALLRVISGSDGEPIPAPDGLPSIELGDSREVRLLDKLIIIGFPQGGGTSVTVNEGIVEGKDIIGNWIKTSARLIHGNSGGAAVDSVGRLIGIPTRVVIDKALIRKDGRAARDSGSAYEAAAIGFLRPAHLVQSMLDSLEPAAESIGSQGPDVVARPEKRPEARPAPPVPDDVGVTVRGLVKAADDQHPIAGARVGLLPLGASDVTAGNLVAWGGTNADGRFELNKHATPGRYTIKVRAFGYQDFVGDVSIGQEALVILLRRSP